MNRPLANKTVLVTRPRNQAADFVASLEANGANVIVMPSIEIVAPEDFGPLDQALRGLALVDWVIFTSVNAVESIANRMAELGVAAAEVERPSVAAVGSATAAALAERLRGPDVVPVSYVSDAIAAWLGDVAGKRILLPQADLARQTLADALIAAGAEVSVVTAYRILRSTAEVELPKAAPDYITLTSSESARSAKEMLEQAGRGAWMAEAAIVCIGPVTAETVRGLGYEPASIAEEFTTPGLLDALIRHAAREAAHA